MDLSSLSAKEDPQSLTIVNPVTGLALMHAASEGADETPVVWYTHGSDSHVYRDTLRRIANRDAARTSTAGVSKSHRAENVEANGISLLVAVCTGWSPNLMDGDTCPDFSKEAATTLLTKYLWLQQQVDAFVHDRSEHLGN